MVLVPEQCHWCHPRLLPTSSGSRNLLGHRAQNGAPVHALTAIPAECRSPGKLIYPAAYETMSRAMSMPEITQNGKCSSLLHRFICTKLHLPWRPCWRSPTGTHASYMRCWLCKNRSGTTLSNEKLYAEWEFKTKFKTKGFKTNYCPQSDFSVSLKKQHFLTAVNLFFHYWGSSSSSRSIALLCIFINQSIRSILIKLTSSCFSAEKWNHKVF